MLKILIIILIFIFQVILLSSCGTAEIDLRANKTPIFIPEEAFIGDMQGVGGIFSRGGSLRRSFILNLNGSQSEDGFLLKEELIFDDGEVEYRDYTIRNIKSATYEASATSGLVGTAKIKASGNMLQWDYVFEIPYNSKIRHMRFDDRMYLQEDGSIINRAFIYWYGLRVAELFMVIKKRQL